MRALRAIYHYLGRFLLFWRDFLIGDDWWGAGIVVAGLGLTYVAVRLHIAAFWIPVLFVLASLGQNLWRARRKAARSVASKARPGDGTGGRAAPPRPR